PALRRRDQPVGTVDDSVAVDVAARRQGRARPRRRRGGAGVTARALTAKTVDLVALVKPNIMIMALLTAAGAMSLAPVATPTAVALALLAGTALIVGAANTLNMWLERDVDCLMSRTKNRPLPQQRLSASTALWFGAL